MSEGRGGPDHGAVADHLAEHLAPTGGSRGLYLPGKFDLHLRGAQDGTNQMVHHHEAQHVVLTSTTAWGAALTVASRMPRWGEVLAQLLDRCRITHESYATYMSCSMLSAGLSLSAAALAPYPQYVPLADRLERFAVAIPGEHRRSLAVNALARVCMQTPILEQMIASWPVAVTMDSIRAIDTPDERLSHLLREPGGLPAAAVAVADAKVAADFGPEPLAADLADRDAVLDDGFDEAWERWEDAVFAVLAARLAGVGASVVGSHDHLSAASTLVGLVKTVAPALDVTVLTDHADPGQRMVTSVLNHARLWLAEMRLPAQMLTVGQDVDLAEALRVTEATTRVAGRPNLVLHARLPARLLDGYQLPESDRAALTGLDRPVLVSRTIADDGTDTQTDTVWLVRWDEPADVADLARLWAGRGDLTCCVAVSCLADEQWRADWLPVLQQTAPIVWLIDVPIQTLSQEFCAGRIVYGTYLDLDLTPPGTRRAVAFKVMQHAGTWLALADHVGVELITQQVADLPGIDLRMTGAQWRGLDSTLRLALLDLLRTESYVDLRALTDHPG